MRGSGTSGTRPLTVAARSSIVGTRFAFVAARSSDRVGEVRNRVGEGMDRVVTVDRPRLRNLPPVWQAPTRFDQTYDRVPTVDDRVCEVGDRVGREANRVGEGAAWASEGAARRREGAGAGRDGLAKGSSPAPPKNIPQLVDGFRRPPKRGQIRSRMQPRAALLLMTLCTLAVVGDVRGAAPLPLPGPAPQRRSPRYDAAAENAACEGCHGEIAREWRASLHRRAWEDGVFQAAYAIEPLAFCRGCHAPEADPARAPSPALRRLGVGCVTCHVQENEIIGARPRPATALVHAVRGDARLGTSAACERCHQFEFPRPAAAPMQGTGDEHRASKHASTPCQGCHMPLVRSAGRAHRSHDFHVLDNPTLLRSAISARAERASDRAVSVTLSVARAGHAVPTGDMFRRLVVRAQTIDEGAPLAAPPVALARRFVTLHRPDGLERRDIGDDRLPATGDPRAAWLWFAGPIHRRAVRWEVVYQTMDEGLARLFGVDLAKDEVILAQGTLPPDEARR